ncbi:MAG: hypothetical protein JKY93_13145 [Gammaproteobacteria bacterium]|nr:hypothetical protein [Gammaproteobacteria bacterium]
MLKLNKVIVLLGFSLLVNVVSVGVVAGEGYEKRNSWSQKNNFGWDRGKIKSHVKKEWDEDRGDFYDQNVDLHKAIFDGITHDVNPIVVFGEPKGSKLEFLRTGASTCGKYLYVKATVPPGSGPPPHLHHWTEEWFYTPTGGVVMFQGQTEYKDLDVAPDVAGRDLVELIPLEKHFLTYGPTYKVHGYTNATDKPIEMHIVWTPDTPDVSILGYFLSIYSPIFEDDDLNTNFHSVQQIKAVSEAKKYGMNFSQSFWQYIEDIRFAKADVDPKVDKLIQVLREGDMPCE